MDNMSFKWHDKNDQLILIARADYQLINYDGVWKIKCEFTPTEISIEGTLKGSPYLRRLDELFSCATVTNKVRKPLKIDRLSCWSTTHCLFTVSLAIWWQRFHTGFIIISWRIRLSAVGIVIYIF